MENKRVTILDLFDSNIVLRDLEPLNSGIAGLSKIRETLLFEESYIPRKNEVPYVKVLESFISHIGGDIRNVLYVGDSYFNDGSVIVNLSKLAHLNVCGFLCNQTKSMTGDFLIGNIIFSDDWSSLWKLAAEAKKRGFTINERTIGLFDLDNTTYAAKGRDSEPLTMARLDAMHILFSDALGPQRYRKKRAEKAFREFDTDEYHPYTLDNLDYVVFLSLVYCLQFYDLPEIKEILCRNGLTSLCEQVLDEVEKRRESEDLGTVYQIVREIHFNMRNGDKTPLKSFRSKEYLSTANWMMREDHSKGGIAITKEVSEFVEYLRSNNAHVMAVSDRPLEATSPWDNTGPSLVEIKMQVTGKSIRDNLR